jgi:hypothetical protein
VSVRVYDNGDVTAVAVGQSQRLYSGVRIFMAGLRMNDRGSVAAPAPWGLL